jgi:hypothetical protein
MLSQVSFVAKNVCEDEDDASPRLGKPKKHKQSKHKKV